MYGGTSPATTFNQVVDLVNVEIDKEAGGLTEDEVAKAKTQIRRVLVLRLENMSSRMMRNGKSLLYSDEVIPLELS